jgi:hypothetical protein
MNTLNERYREKLTSSAMVLVEMASDSSLRCGIIQAETSLVLILHPCIKLNRYPRLWSTITEDPTEVLKQEQCDDDYPPETISFAEGPIHIPWANIREMTDLPAPWREELIRLLTESQGEQER